MYYPTPIIRKWYCEENGEPGFTSEAFQSITLQVQNSNGPIICNIVIDEMAIRKQISFMNEKCYGFVDLGTSNNVVQDNVKEAINA